VVFIRSDANHIQSDCSLSPRSKRIADYWLSIWKDNPCPSRPTTAPVQIKDFLSGLIFFQVVPGCSITVRMAGTDFLTLLKYELTGKDWLAETPFQDREERLAIYSQVACGSIAIGRWTFQRHQMGETCCEKLLLPMRPRPGVDGIPVLGFVDWTSAGMRPDHPPCPASIPLPQIIDLAIFTKDIGACGAAGSTWEKRPYAAHAERTGNTP
jgi:hypothetical protein